MVARLSAGMSGAELANVCNEAALLAGRRSAEVSVIVHAPHACHPLAWPGNCRKKFTSKERRVMNYRDREKHVRVS